MKQGKYMALAIACTLGHSMQALSQETLPEVTVTAANYKYLKNVGGKEVPVSVRQLERMAASYDIRNSEFYEEDHDSYFISFYLPEGVILAAYDKDGKLLRTAERYSNITLPSAVSAAIAGAFPNWSIDRDVYLVNYFDDGAKATKKYKLVLRRGNRRMRVQMNERGELIGGG
jgi:hypothetical protein